MRMDYLKISDFILLRTMWKMLFKRQGFDIYDDFNIIRAFVFMDFEM